MRRLAKSAGLVAVAACLWGRAAAALELKAVEVGAGVYAVIGDLGPPTEANEGLNANLGFVVGGDQVAVIDTGPTSRVAQALHAAIRRVTDKPVRWVVNTNSQAQRWLGNRYFAGIGARIVTQQRALGVMREQGGMQLGAMRDILGAKAAGTELSLPGVAFAAGYDIDLGGLPLHLRHFGPAHTPGDSVVWLPRQRILFAGDIVYTGRLLAILPTGSSGGWINAFDAALGLGPAVIVPGHGNLAQAESARRETRDYLVHLRVALKPLVEEGVSLPDALARVDQSAFAYLANFRDLARRNAQQVYLDLERE
jgi:glyoxylase-like metal-dependent hydrolase (beta-lactamase superfamily II)